MHAKPVISYGELRKNYDLKVVDRSNLTTAYDMFVAFFVGNEPPHADIVDFDAFFTREKDILI